MAHYCCNPFGLPNHNWSTREKSLRSVTSWMCEKAPISMGSKICDNCRRKLSKTTVDMYVEHEVEINSSQVDDDSSEHYVDPSEAISSLNQCLAEIGETPYVKSKSHQRHYPEKKIKKITDAMKRTFITDCDNTLGDENEIIEQLKKKFELAIPRSEQLQILTVLPRSWTLKKIQDVFQTSDYMARKAKQLVEEKGILSTPNPKPGHSLPSKSVDLIKSFYESDDISRAMPGKKDFVSIRQGEKRVQVQKRLVLSNLKEVYLAFKVQFPNEKIGFSKFAECRPRNCILAGASGTHSVCVCTIHQNVKLMTEGVKLSNLSASGRTGLDNYHHCLTQILCNPPSPSCYLGSCDACPGIDVLRDILVALLDENLIDNVMFKQWVSVDRSTLETYSMSTDEFVDMFCEKLELLRPHYFIANQQAKFYKDCKLHLSPGEMLVTVDFSENYSFVLQDAAQGYHWNNSQATLHPFVGYYIGSGEIQHLSYVIISECLHHDTVAVYLFQKCFITFLRKVIPTGQPIKKILYFSDGAASQYKNRKHFLNLCHHEEDFGFPAEWHFSATSHGKGACDGLGGTVKRLAARASLQRPYDQQIMTPRQLFDWATIAISAVHFEYCTIQDYEREKENLEQRFQASRTIQGTRKLHSFVPTSKDTVAVKPYSASTVSKEVKVISVDSEVPPANISGFVTCVYEHKWWLGCVLQVEKDDPLVTVSFLHPHGPCSSFRYPAAPEVHTLIIRDILTSVDPRSRSGRVYTLTSIEMKAASAELTKLL